jgi:hypothetical protein
LLEPQQLALGASEVALDLALEGEVVAMAAQLLEPDPELSLD